MPTEFLTPEEFAEQLAKLKQIIIPVLDGSVQLLDVMGHEREICEAARVTAQTTAKLPTEDVGLMRYLMRHRHSTPFEMVEVKLRVKVAMDTWRQWIRHRTANVNEYSTRYSPAIDECQMTPPDGWRLQSVSNRQGSAGPLGDAWPNNYVILPLDDELQPSIFLSEETKKEQGLWGVFAFDSYDDLQEWHFDNSKLMLKYFGNYANLTPSFYLSQREKEFVGDARDTYEERLKFGVAKEQARKDLPLSTMTIAVWKIDLHNLLHFLSLRMDSHAQFEIRQYANAIGQIVSSIYPVAWRAFENYRLNAMQLSELDILTISKLHREYSSQDGRWSKAAFLGSIPEVWKGNSNRERDECWSKLVRLGIVDE